MLSRITLGDWLGKGHDIKEDFLYDCNRPAAEIAAAYGMSREKYGVRFDGFKKDDPFAVWTGYGESGMSPEARGALERAGLLDGGDEPWRMRDRADLDAYAEYHPSFAKALGEWRTAQAKENE